MTSELHRLAAEAAARLEITVTDASQWPVAVDFETFYRTEKLARRTSQAPCTVELSGNWGYCRHPEWEAYMVSIWSPACPKLGLKEVSYVGDPKLAPWGEIAGRTWLSHNRNFDRHVWERLEEISKGVTWGHFAVWHDTADLAVWSHLPRALAKAVAEKYRLTLDKGARTSMDGVRWSDVPAEDKQRILDYALDDSVSCWLLWADLAPEWPEHERKLSLHTGNIEFRGIPVNRAGVERDIGVLETALWKTRERIPWVDKEDEDTGKPYALRSKKALDRECLKCGVPPPESTAQKSKDFLDWLDEYGERVPAIYELARYRRIDRALSVYRALLARIRPDGRAALGLKYMGADKTGRFSGASKFNLQNLLKVPMYFSADYGWLDAADQGKTPDGCAFAVDVRSCITASPGRKLLIPDLSQIEPRVLNWIVGNREFLELLKQKDEGGNLMSPYEAYARVCMGYVPTPGGKGMKRDAPGLYSLAKARLLALGFGAGWQKYIEMARGYCTSEAEFLSLFAVTPTEEQTAKFLSYLDWMSTKMNHSGSRQCRAAWPELDAQTQAIWVNSWTQVRDYRDTNPAVASRDGGLWARLDAGFKASVADGVFENVLPSGRSLKYFSVTPQWGWSCRPGNPLGIPQRTYGGLLCENMVQAIARDVFVHGILNLEAHGYEVLFHVHDEAIIDAPPDADPAEVVRLLCDAPAWAAGLPVASECESSAHYKK